MRDPKRIQVVDVYLMDTVKAGDAGYRVMPTPVEEEEVRPEMLIEGLRVGDRVEVRDVAKKGDKEQDWEAGVVAELLESGRPKVKKNGWHEAFKWDEVRAVQTQPTPEPEPEPEPELELEPEPEPGQMPEEGVPPARSQP